MQPFAQRSRAGWIGIPKWVVIVERALNPTNAVLAGPDVKNNDVLRRVRYIFDFGDAKMIELFGLGACPVTREQVSDWLKQEDDPDFRNCSDAQMAAFLNGLIIDKRGRKDGDQPKPEKTINNNVVFRKLKIALRLESDEILEMMNRVEFRISRHELSALFRRPDHKHYRECKDQILRNFLKGMQKKYRPDAGSEVLFPWRQYDAS